MLICSSTFQAVNNYSISSLAQIKISQDVLEVPNKRPAQQGKISKVDHFNSDYAQQIGSLDSAKF